MADFKTHITTSTVLGVGYGAVGAFMGLPLDHCMVAAGVCGLAGMLPDLDSDSGVPVRETSAFVAAIIPMLMLDRFQHLSFTHEQIALAGGLIYITIRFGAVEIFKRYTVHRGMWHSIPAAITCGLLGFLICSCSDVNLRIFKALAITLGFMSHLVLDELWSIDSTGRKLRLKKSFGTAIKFFSKSTWANVSTYGKLAIVIFIVVGDPIFMETFGDHHEHLPQLPQQASSAADAANTATHWISELLSPSVQR